METDTALTKKMTIAVILGQIDENCQSLILPSMADYAADHDINLIVYIGNSHGEENTNFINYHIANNLLHAENIDGLIINTGVMGYWLTYDEITAFIKKFDDLPVVSISIALDGIPSILTENQSGIWEIVSHLVESHKCRLIAFIKGPEGHDEAEARFAAYKKALSHYGIPFDGNLVVPGSFSRQSGTDAVHLLLEDSKEKIDAIMCADDETAFGAYAALQDLGLCVPKDIIVTGFDDTEESLYCTPSLTTSKQQFYEQGRVAIESVTELIKGKNVPERIFLSTGIVVRESCGCFSEMLERVREFDRPVYEEVRERDIDEITAAILKEFDGSPSKNDNVKAWIDMIIDFLLGDFEDAERSDSFFCMLNDILCEYSKGGGDLSVWHKVLSILFGKITVFLKTSNTSPILNMFYKFRILIEEISICKLGITDFINNNKIWTYQEVYQSLVITYDLSHLLDKVEKSLRELDIRNCYISLYDCVFTAGNDSESPVPEKSRLIFAYQDNVRLKIDGDGISFPTKSLFPDINGAVEMPRLTVFMPLYFKEEQYGLIIFEYQPREKLLYEIIRGSISSALKGKLLYDEQMKTGKELQITLEKLEYLNNQLKNLSIKDELTSLYNRRGFYEHAEHQFKIAKRLKQKFLLFFIDLDKFKSINDQFGHMEGDSAIKDAAGILVQTFRQIDIIARNKNHEGDLIARLGGDEFIVMLLNSTLENIKSIKERLQNNIDLYNLTSRKPYSLSMSVGTAFFEPECNYSFDELLAIADRDLYSEKGKNQGVSIPDQQKNP